MFLLLLSFFSIMYCVSSISISKGENREKTFAYSLIIFCSILYIITELLSLLSLLCPKSIISFWIIVCFVMIFIGTKDRGWNALKTEIKYYLSKNIKKIIVLILFAVPLLLLAYMTVPYNYDSMTYHLTRIFFWAKNKNVGYYATQTEIQNYSAVLSEFIGLHVYLIDGYSDRMLPTIQTFFLYGMLYCLYNVTFKVTRTAEWARIAILIIISTPIVFAESINTQNDIVVACIFMTCINLVICTCYNQVKKEPDKSFFIDIAFIGVGFGLAFATKEYAALPILIIYILLIYTIRKNTNVIKVIQTSVLLFICAIPFVLPERIKLWRIYGRIFASNTSSHQLIQNIKIKYIIVSYLKNLFYNISSDYIYHSNIYIYKWFEKISNSLNISIDDPVITVQNYRLSEGFFYTHDSAKNNLIILLYLMSIIILLLVLLRKKKIEFIGMHLCSIFSITVFLSIMKFTMNRTRYEILFFAFLCPTICYLLKIICNTKTKTYFVLGVISCVCVMELLNLWLFHSEIQKTYNAGNKPDSYFGTNQDLCLSYKNICEKINLHKCERVGLVMSPGVMEYPLLTMIDDETVLKNVNVYNELSPLEDYDFTPDCLVYLGWSDDIHIGDIINCHGNKYKVEYEETINEGEFGLDGFAMRCD